MKKNLKRTLAKVMAVALTVALAGTAAPDADAAKKAKLSAKSVTVVKGKSKKVTIKIGKKNAKKSQVKKLSVKSNKTKIATAKASGKTAVKVTGKKKGSAKVTVSVTLKGQKKATKLSLKVKVTNAKKVVDVTPTAAPTTAPTTAPNVTTPAPVGNDDQGGNGGQGGGQGGGSGTTTDDKDLSKQVYGQTDPYVITISELNEAQATSDKIRALTGADPGGYRKDVEFANNGVKFTSVHAQNSGVAFYIKPISEDDITTKTDAEGKVTVNVNAEKVDLTQYTKIEIDVEEAWTETSLKVFGNASSFWNKQEKFEGADNFSEGSRTVTYDISKWDDAFISASNAKNAEAIGVSWHNSNDYGSDSRIKEIRLVGAKEPTELAPVADMTLAKSNIAVGESTTAEVSVQNAEVEDVTWSTSDAANEVEIVKDTANPTKAKIIAKAEVETATIVASVTTKKGATLEVKKTLKVRAAGKELTDFPITITADNTISASDNTNTFKVENGVAKMSDQSNYDDCIGITVELPQGSKLTDYAGIQFTLKNAGTGSINKWTQAVVNEEGGNWLEWNGKGNGGNLGWYKKILASNYAESNYTDQLAAGASEDIVLSFANGTGVPENIPNKFLLMIGVKGIGKDSNGAKPAPYEISNVKLLAKLPTA
ncbi:MAG: hypothetical protein NC293_08850 [Roseburia sp.]|nr:hypothetical protein [Roseburia sp.]